MPKLTQQVELTQAQIEAISQWQQTKAQLDEVKSTEMQQRMEIVRTAPFREDKEEGSQTLKLNGGWRLVLDRPVDHAMPSKDIPAVMKCLDALHAHNPDAVDGLVRWVPVLSVSAYKKLTDEEKVLIAPVVTIKPGTPTIELKAPATPKV